MRDTELPHRLYTAFQDADLEAELAHWEAAVNSLAEIIEERQEAQGSSEPERRDAAQNLAPKLESR